MFSSAAKAIVHYIGVAQEIFGKAFGSHAFLKMNLYPIVTLLANDVRHVLTHRIILANFYLLQTNSRPQLPAEYIWIKQDEISHYAVPRLVELLFEAVSQKGLL